MHSKGFEERGMLMCYYIVIEDLVANALIENLKRGSSRFITYRDIENYGAKVIELLNEKSEKAVLILSRQGTNAMLRDYSKYFEEKEVDGLKGIELRSAISEEELINKFRGYLPLDILLAFVNAGSTQAWGG